MDLPSLLTGGRWYFKSQITPPDGVQVTAQRDETATRICSDVNAGIGRASLCRLLRCVSRLKNEHPCFVSKRFNRIHTGGANRSAGHEAVDAHVLKVQDLVLGFHFSAKLLQWSNPS